MANNIEKNNQKIRKLDPETIIRGQGAVDAIRSHSNEVVDQALALNRTAEMIRWGLKIKGKIISGEMKMEDLPERGVALLNIIKAIEESGIPPFILKRMFLDSARGNDNELMDLGNRTKVLQNSRKMLEASGFLLSERERGALRVMDLAGVGSFPKEVLERALGYTYSGRSPLERHRGHIIARQK